MRIDHCVLIRIIRDDMSVELHAVPRHLPVGAVAGDLQDGWLRERGNSSDYLHTKNYTLRRLGAAGVMCVLDHLSIIGDDPLVEMALHDVTPRAPAG